MSPHFLGEFLGTAVLTLLGCGVVAGVLLAKSKSNNAGWIVVTAGWAFAVACGIFTAKAFGADGALNPVGPIADLVQQKIATAKAVEMIAGEFLGAFTGAVLVWLAYLAHWKETPDQAAKLGVFATAPAIRNPGANLLTEIIATFALVFVASAIGKASIGAIEPAFVGMLIWGLGLSLGGPTGYSLNPARDLAPRIAHALLPIAGKGGSDWNYAWIPVVGPIIGGVLGALLFKALSN